MKTSYLIIVALIIFLSNLSTAFTQEFESAFFPGLTKLFDENAPSDLDKWLEKAATNDSPPTSVEGLITYVSKPILQLGLGGYHAKRECMSEGIVSGYSIGVAVGLWEEKFPYLRNKLLVKVHGSGSTLPQRCKKIQLHYYNAALARGYVDALNIPTKRRRHYRDLLTLHIEEDKSWLPLFTVEDVNGKPHSDFYITYANAFEKHLVRRK